MDTILRMSFSTCLKQRTDRRDPQLLLEESLYRSSWFQFWFDFGVFVTKTSACFRKRKIPMQADGTCLNDTMTRNKDASKLVRKSP